uniref:Putative salivary kunitz domain protein n=1 Tax=Ixodes ricinus TaxID=34613 RepID=A0A147BFN7_IXORI
MAKIINSLLLVTAIITFQGVISTSSKIDTYEPLPDLDYDGDDSEESTAPLTKTEPTAITPSETIPAPSPNKTATNEEPENKPGGAVPGDSDSDDEDSDEYDDFDVITFTEAPTTTTAQGVPATPAPEPAYTAAYVPDAPRRPKVCMLEEDVGECDGEERGPGEARVFFNNKTNSCDIFIYSGCKGNGNNFATEEECTERCRIGAVYDIKEDARLPKVCKLRMTPGHCESGQDPELRYFYNQYTERCEVFTYSGCGGNENNFKTEHDCETRCIYTPDGACTLQPEKGPCAQNFTRFYWDKELGDCKEFVYSGCAGNENNFPDKESCQKYCKAKSTYLELWRNVWSAMQSWMKRGYS